MKSLLAFLVVLMVNGFGVHAQDEFLADPANHYPDSLKELLRKPFDSLSVQDLTIALEIRHYSKRYALNNRIYTTIIRSTLKVDQPELAERYARELFPVFQLLNLNREHKTRGIECRNVCFYLSEYYYNKGNFQKGNYYRKLTLTRFLSRFCGTGAIQHDYKLMLELIDNYQKAGRSAKAKHWQRKAKRFHRRHLE